MLLCMDEHVLEQEVGREIIVHEDIEHEGLVRELVLQVHDFSACHG